MASTATSLLKLEKPANGDYRGIWGPVFNAIMDRLDEAIAGLASVVTTGGTTVLTDTDFLSNQARNSGIAVSGILVANAIIQVPSRAKKYEFYNLTTGAFTVSVKTAGGVAVVLPRGFITKVRVLATGEVLFSAPPADVLTGKVSDSTLATVTALTAETNRATAAEVALSNAIAAFQAIQYSNIKTSLYSDLAADGLTFASGTRMLFQQTSVPIGYTKENGSAYNDAALRFTTGNVSTGGTTDFQTVFASRTLTGTVGSDTPSISKTAAHTHTDAKKLYNGVGGGGGNKFLVDAASNVSTGVDQDTPTTSSSIGSGTAHNHSLTMNAADFAVKFAMATIGIKN